MNRVIRTTFAALIVAAAGIAASAPTAMAGGIGFELSIGGPGGSMIVRDHDRRGSWDRFEDHRGGRDRHDDRRGGWDRSEGRHGGWDRDACRPGQALRLAGDMGLRRAEIVRAGRNRVVVEGFRRHRPVRVVFANDRNCPVIGWDR